MPGIEAGYFETVFGMFKSLGPRDELDSAGVGLAISNKIVQQYGGDIWVESELGQGSKFVFTIPK